MSERINGVELIDEAGQSDNTWDSLAEVPFNDGEGQELGRTELEQQTIDKLGKKPGVKKILQKAILGAVASTVLAGGLVGAVKGFERQNEKQSIGVEKFIELATAFVDKDSDDLVWFEKITDDAGSDIEFNQVCLDKGKVYNDGMLQDDITHVDITWWEGHGPMYSIIDQDADGKWDVLQKYDVYEDELFTMQLDDLENVDIASIAMSSAEQLFD